MSHLGTTKASLATESFFSAASFQETTRVLTDEEDPDTPDFGLTRRRTFSPGHIEVTLHARALQVRIGGSTAAAAGAHR